MSAELKEVKIEHLQQLFIFQNIENHPAWHGSISGLRAEKLLRGRKTPYLFILRAGESKGDYYVTFVMPDLTIKHQPFVITITPEGWHFESCGVGGPFITTSINDVIHLIMQCKKKACTPKVNSDS